MCSLNIVHKAVGLICPADDQDCLHWQEPATPFFIELFAFPVTSISPGFNVWFWRASSAPRESFMWLLVSIFIVINLNLWWLLGPCTLWGQACSHRCFCLCQGLFFSAPSIRLDWVNAAGHHGSLMSTLFNILPAQISGNATWLYSTQVCSYSTKTI